MSVDRDIAETDLGGGADVLALPVRQTDLLAQVEVIGEREGGLIECYVPMELVCTEDVPVGENHVEELARSMAESGQKDGGTGQLTPVLLGLIEGENQLRIIDGFHRTASLQARSEPTVYATVRKSTWEEVIDLRILTARTHKLVQFARIVEWVNDAWERSEWGDRLDVSQAFVLGAELASSTGRRLGLDAETAQSVRDWVKTKCEQWQTHPMTIYQHLSVANVASPDLVREARAAKHGKKLESITPGHLKVIAKGLPSDFSLQHLVADTAKTRNLTIPETRALVTHLKSTGEVDLEQAHDLIGAIEWGTWAPEFSETRTERKKYLDLTAGEGKVLASLHLNLARVRQLLEELGEGTAPLSQREHDRLLQAHDEAIAISEGMVAIRSLIEGVLASRPLPEEKPAKPAVAVDKLVNKLLGDNPPPPRRKTGPKPRRPRPEDLPETIVAYRGHLTDFLNGQGELPAINTRTEIRQAELMLQAAGSGPIYLREELREEIKDAQERLRRG